MNIFKLPIDRGKTNISHSIQAMKFVHDLLPNLRALDFSLSSLLKMELEAVHNLLKFINTNRPFLTGSLEAIEDFEAIERFSPPVLLHHQGKGILSPFACGKSFMAAETLSPPPNRIFFLSQSGIDHLTLGMIAEWTFHFLNVVSGMWKVDFYIGSLLSTLYPPFAVEFFNLNS